MAHHLNHMPLIDAFRVIATQLVVLNHLAAYGPLPLAAREIIPGAIDWFYNYGRLAVQVFLVISGFLAARSVSTIGDGLRASPFVLIWKRYLRLAIPYVAAIVLAITCAAIADRWMIDESIPSHPTLLQLLAHVLLLNLTGF